MKYRPPAKKSLNAPQGFPSILTALHPDESGGTDNAS